MISSAKPAYKVPDLSEPSRVCTAVRVSLRYKVVLNNKQISFIADHSFDEISSVEKISLAATQPSPNSFRIVRNSWQFLTIMPASDPLASFNKMHIVEYGLTIIGRDPVTHQMCASERCQSFAFCGREEKVGAKRKKTGNVKYFDKFKTQYYEQLVKTQHA
ncbi:hypothetical protein PBRA_007178 [Plasmodiophora brassicae]|nr:hypothetical protein PBRA_007178 [Plasmodiophora brassicae]